MRVKGNIPPKVLSMEAYDPMPGHVEVRLRENIKEITLADATAQTKGSLYEYDEYVFHLKEKQGLRQEIEANMGDWLATGRMLEMNERASAVQDMREALGMLGVARMNVIKQAQAVREAMDCAGASLGEETALACVRLYRAWRVGVAYQAGDYLTYGVNGVGDPQLYKVAQSHTAQADWAPDSSPALYVALGLDEGGCPVWAQPTGAHDAYNTGDVVDYNGTLYISRIDGNTWRPNEYPTGWEVYTENTAD